jgi:Ca2+-transporting ATPase
MVALLLAAAGIALLVGDRVDAGAIMAVLAVNLLIGFTLELRAQRAVESLRSLEVAHARVMRDGALRDLDARELVPGDVIEVEAGSAIPADARLLDTVELRTMESALTGESAPVDKNPNDRLPPEAPLADRTTMVYQATTAVAGRGRAVVVATGMATEVGRIGALVSGIAVHRTPLELRLDALGRRFAVIAVGVAFLVSLIALRQGGPLGELVQTALALAVAAVPEGLPIVGTIAMAVGVRRMAHRQALIRRLPVVETLGSATVICTDKTGTLTAGAMMVNTLRLDDQEVSVTGTGFAPQGQFTIEGRPVDPLRDSRLQEALRVCGLTARGDVVLSQETWTAVGDPTEAAMAAVARKAGLTQAALTAEWPEVRELPFTSRRMLMATFHRTPSGIIVLAKGAPNRILQLCTRKLTATGSVELGPSDRDELLRLNRELAGRGLRVLALAQKEVGAVAQGELHGLTWVAFAGITDPPASGVKDTVANFHRAGIRVVMLTGDQQHTAERVARDLGLLTPGTVVVDGREVDRLSEDGLREAVAGAAAFSRVSPEAKLRIVKAHQARGEIVAMLGDGINDAAALRQADIGVAMGQRGTDLAKEAADVILEDDRFPSIASAIEQGRVVFDNIRKFVFYLFSCNLAEIMVLLGAGMAGLPPPLRPLQILWLNLLTDTVPALALAGEPADRNHAAAAS